MEARKRYIRLAVTLWLMLLCAVGCGSGDQGPIDGKGLASGKKETAGTETETVGETPRQLYLVSQADTEQGLLLLLNLDTGRYEQYAYTDGTFFLDKYGNHTSGADFSPGRAVNITLRDGSLILDTVQISGEAWEYDDVTRFSVDEEQNMITLGDTRYSYDDDLMVYLGDEEYSLSGLSEQDTLRVCGVDRKVLSVVVTTGHGFIRLVNTQDLEGGWVSLNHKRYYKITEDMELEVPEGTYEVTVAGNGYGGSVEVTVDRGAVSAVNVDEIKGEGPKYCTMTFELGVEQAKLYVDGSEVDVSEPLQLQYGIHRLQVEAEGYDSWSKRLFVNSPEATLEIALTESGSGEDTEDSSEDTVTSTETEDSKTEDEYLDTLQELVDTLVDTNRVNADSTIMDSVLDSLMN